MFVNGEPVYQGRVLRQDLAHALNGTGTPAFSRGLYGPFKVCLDVLLAFILLVLSAPVTVLACLLVKLTSPGPMIYCQTRLGRGGKPYTIYKIRTMAHNCEQASGICWAQPNDRRDDHGRQRNGEAQQHALRGETNQRIGIHNLSGKLRARHQR